MKAFEEYLDNGDVKQQPIDKNLAKSLIEQAVRRLARADGQKIDEESCDFVLEDYYEAMRMLADAQLALHGYKSLSHEATIAYIEKDKDFTPTFIVGFDRLRKLRHGIKYYGKRVTIADAKEAQQLAKILFLKLKPKLI